MRDAAERATRLVLAFDHRPTPRCEGTIDAIASLRLSAAVATFPLGGPYPQLPEVGARWSRLEVPVCWGVEEPLIDYWARKVEAGSLLALPDPGPVFAAPMDHAITAIETLLHRPGTHWRMAGNPMRLRELVEALAESRDTTARVLPFPIPLSLACAMARVRFGRIRGWWKVPVVEEQTDEWYPVGLPTDGWVDQPLQAAAK